MHAHRILSLACLNFFTIGLLAAVLGPALPDLARQTGSPLAAVGGVLSTLFVGALLAQVIGGPLNDQLGARPLLLVGYGCVALGMLTLVLSHVLLLTLAAGVLAGVGHGAIDISTSVMVAVASGERSVVALNFINVFFGVGAVAGPAFASLALQRWHTTFPALWLGVILALALMPCIFLLPHIPRVVHPHGPNTPARSLYGMPILWLIAGIFLLYVGLENGVGGWIAVYVQRTTAVKLGIGALVASSFWLALTGGRILATLFGSRLTAYRLLLVSVGCLLVGALVLASSTGYLAVTILATALLGLGCGPVFPTALAITTTTFPRFPGQAASTVIGLGSIGGIIVPWVQGIILTRSSPQLSMGFIALLAGGMVLLGNQLLRASKNAKG